MKKCICKKEKGYNKNRRRNVKKIRVLPVIERKGNTSLPVYRYDEHHEILEEMAKKALEVLKD